MILSVPAYIHDVVQIPTYTLTKHHSVDCACNRLHVHSLPQRIIWSHCIMMSVISQVYSMSFRVDFVIMPCWQPLWYHHLESMCISMQTKLCWIVTSPGSPPPKQIKQVMLYIYIQESFELLMFLLLQDFRVLIFILNPGRYKLLSLSVVRFWSV